MKIHSLPRCDKEGFLLDLNAWSESNAELLAAREGVTLTPAHWEILHLLRDFYRRTETAPAMRPFVKLIKETCGSERGSSVYLMTLFGGSPAMTAAKIAGLPRPTNCL
ncbi:MAG: TusE/DsrC/DsvC family sulfur relay protein [Gammaproteobacteria bacterium]|jgi:tRNA 2-thiouridine synthesizing protein E